MIVVDSSVWIANLRNTDTLSVRKLTSVSNSRKIIVGDIVLLEILQRAKATRTRRLFFQRFSNIV